MIKKNDYIFCLDGGASKSRSAVFDINGNILEKNFGGLCNIENNFSLSLNSIDDHLKKSKILKNIRKKNIIISLGLAGGRNKAKKNIIRKKLYKYKKIFISTDGHISLLSILKNTQKKEYENIASFNIGTGSVIHFFINEDTQFQIGGWGHIFGDQCSGYWIGNRLTAYLLKYIDNIEKNDPIYKDLIIYFGNKDQIVMKKIIDNDVEKIASLFKIFLKFLNKSKIVKKIYKEIITEYITILNYLVNNKKKKQIYLSGGLSKFYFQNTPKKFKKIVFINKTNPLYGAYLMTQKKEFVENLYNDKRILSANK